MTSKQRSCGLPLSAPILQIFYSVPTSRPSQLLVYFLFSSLLCNLLPGVDGGHQLIPISLKGSRGGPIKAARAAENAGSSAAQEPNSSSSLSSPAAIQQAYLNSYNYIVQTAAALAATSAPLGRIFSVQGVLADSVGLQVARLDTASLTGQGFSFNEFRIPPGVTVDASVPQVLLVYRKFSNFSAPYTPAPDTSFDSSIVGLSVITADTTATAVALSATSTNPITVQLTPLGGAPAGDGEQCSTFNSTGDAVSAGLTTSSSSPSASGPVTCSTTSLGDFVVLLLPPSISLGPPRAPPLLPPSIPPPSSPPPPKHKKSSNAVAVGLGVGLGVGIPLLVLLALLGLFCLRRLQQSKIARMEHEADRGVPLRAANVGGNRAYAAGPSRTLAAMEPDGMYSERI